MYWPLLQSTAGSQPGILLLVSSHAPHTASQRRLQLVPQLDWHVLLGVWPNWQVDLSALREIRRDRMRANDLSFAGIL